MAAIETLAGIEKIGRLQYVVTKNVALPAGIDDMLNCVFNQRNGGILRFASGNATTFTACSFVEETTALALRIPKWARAVHALAQKLASRAACGNRSVPGQILIQHQERSSHSQKAPAERLASGSSARVAHSTTTSEGEL